VLLQEQAQLRAALAEMDVSFIVALVDAEAHFFRDYDGEVKPAVDVERWRARMRRGLGPAPRQSMWPSPGCSPP